jgi:uncharacterized NAD-dependent epimerase/dehydratase family protein
MKAETKENAIVLCEGAYKTTNGKTAHGLVRRSERFRILSIVDSHSAGEDAGEIIDGKSAGIPIIAKIDEAIEQAKRAGAPATHLIVGLAPDGGRLPDPVRLQIYRAVSRGLHVVSGLHDFLNDDSELKVLAVKKGVVLIDVRRPKERKDLHFFSGKIEEVGSTRIAVLGTDSAVGKRTTAWQIVDGLRASGISTELVGTGQTAWMQGADYSVVFDSLINDFVSGEIEHAVWSAWRGSHPGCIVIEGQGSLMNPAYPGGFEILAAGRPHCVVLQHVPGREEYDGFPGYPIHPLAKQIQVIELISGKKVVAITVNPEGLDKKRVAGVCRGIEQDTGLPAINPLTDDIAPVLEAIHAYHPKG